MSHFLQIGHQAINIYKVLAVEIRRQKREVDVFISSTTSPSHAFRAEAADAFLDWWDNKADAWVCPVLETE